MKKSNTAAATVTVAANTHAPVSAPAWSFAPEAVTVNGRKFAAEYSLAKSGDVFAFAQVGDASIRVHVGKGTPLHEGALAAASEAANMRKAKPAPVDAAAPAPAPAVEAPAAPAPAPAPAPVDAAPAKPARKARKAKPAPVDAAAPAPAVEAPAAPAPVVVTVPAPVAVGTPAPIGDKSFVGTTITGKGWNIVFDEKAQRTRVIFQADPTQAQLDAVNAAGFFWSAAMGSFNKKLTCKAYRAAQQLAATLNALA